MTSRVDVYRDGKLVDQLPVSGGTVSADRTRAQPRDFTVDVPASAERTPEDLTSLLAPGTRLQLFMGPRLEDVDIRSQIADVKGGWEVSNVSTGVMNGVVVSPIDGALVLGP